ncbi:hypothetical protein J2793_007320 [Paraburkholderia caledonica]|uniref:Uncharacterized protein n=1 Tax=Paraburkholderia caledonica TaxID=134536 RepID=A0AB73IPK4_9BURK|nr:hypothetical protein [Paraburkholderia caledonica]
MPKDAHGVLGASYWSEPLERLSAKTPYKTYLSKKKPTRGRLQKSLPVGGAGQVEG